MTKILKMGSDPVKELHGKERSQQKTLAPKKRTGPSEDVGRREEEPN